MNLLTICSEFIYDHYGIIIALLSFSLSLVASIHALMNKNDVSSAVGWVVFILFSPLLGAIIYFIFGINRIRRKNIKQLRIRMKQETTKQENDRICNFIKEQKNNSLISLNKLGDSVSRFSMTYGNEIELLVSGDLTYRVMLEYIEKAEKSIILESYIFDRTGIGKTFVETLKRAVDRGVEVRVLIDAVGARYSFPSVYRSLVNNNIPVATFNGNLIAGLRLPYANLRTHRKILIIDGEVAFTGGMNISNNYFTEYKKEGCFQDVHFKVKGPAVRDLFKLALEDWYFTTKENLNTERWSIKKADNLSSENSLVRVVASGPDDDFSTNLKIIIGALSVAQKYIYISTPYFLPDNCFIVSLLTAARRGVMIDIVVPYNNNVKLIFKAMFAQFNQLLTQNCRIWLSQGQFDHSKLFTMDGVWSYVGSSNLDPRSFRLNFEVDMEIVDKSIANKIEKIINNRKQHAIRVTNKMLRNQPFYRRLINKVIWLGSAYL
ncbi:cardiolipin synthase [Bartonella sp. DGB1]|uniref:cardiolipin synthase n=1 Tax=Bartonella sp. DGB1 TaxID=3239807 RepID=UPI003526BE5E